MQYDEEIAKKMLNDQRYVGAINEKMLKVWKVRNTIPNQYFNKKYVKLIKEGNNDLANQVKDPFYNDDFTVRLEQTPEEKKAHDRLLVVLSNSKINTSKVLEITGISIDAYNDAKKGKTHLRPEHVLKLKKAIQELRIRMKTLVDKYQNKNFYSASDKSEADKILSNDCLKYSLIIDNNLYRTRFQSRINKKTTLYEEIEFKHYLDKFLIFLLETSL